MTVPVHQEHWEVGESGRKKVESLNVQKGHALPSNPRGDS